MLDEKAFEIERLRSEVNNITAELKEVAKRKEEAEERLAIALCPFVKGDVVTCGGGRQPGFWIISRITPVRNDELDIHNNRHYLMYGRPASLERDGKFKMTYGNQELLDSGHHWVKVVSAITY